jgi:hypothetical protein
MDGRGRIGWQRACLGNGVDGRRLNGAPGAINVAPTGWTAVGLVGC